MTSTTCHARKPCVIAGDQPNFLSLGKFRQIARALVATSRIKKDLLDTGRILPQAADDGVETEYEANVRHLVPCKDKDRIDGRRATLYFGRQESDITWALKANLELYSPFPANTKSILLVSRSTRTTLTRSRSPRRYRLPLRSPSSMCLAASKWK